MAQGRSLTRWSWREDWWVAITLIPVGFFAWIGPLYAGARARRALWFALGIAWAIVWWAGALWDDVVAGHDTDMSGGLLVLCWFGALATALAIRPAYRRALSDPQQRALRRARDRLRRRRAMLKLAREEPELAKELGTRGTGLVDVNNASVAAIEELPGVGRALAERIVEVREQVGGFSSVEELGAVADLDGALVERIRDDVVFLPR
jgi:competence ComEA-like helix-hairpin-helix protein